MPAFKTPTFEERAQAAREAKEKALERLRTKPPVDEAALAQRLAARAAKEAAEAEKRRAKRAAEEAAKEAKRAEARRIAEAEAEAAAAALAEANKPKRTDAELKAARDARYAERKKKKR